MLERSLKAYLILENGRVFKGRAFGYLKEAVGETVFNTSMVGYQEMLTDPSYAGQIVMMTYPLIGNSGTNLEDMESRTPRLKALIVREKCDKPNNWRCEMEIDGFLKQHKITGIEGVDTRSIMRMLREEGTMKAIVTTRNPFAENPSGMAELTKSQIKQKFEAHNNKHIVRETTCAKSYTLDGHAKSKHVGVIDLGVKAGLLRELTGRGYKVTVYPAYTAAETILNDNIDGVFVSNGPGSPLDIPEIVETVKALAEKKPVFGVCLGHQVVSLALGCSASKLKFGHHGANYPVKDLKTGRVYITAQNNDFSVTNLPDDVEETFKNINDGTVEGIRHKTRPVFSVQFCPETAADPCHTGFVFDIFNAALEGGKINA